MEASPVLLLGQHLPQVIPAGDDENQGLQSPFSRQRCWGLEQASCTPAHVVKMGSSWLAGSPHRCLLRETQSPNP